MAKETISAGARRFTQSADTYDEALAKANRNFDEIYSSFGDGSTLGTLSGLTIDLDANTLTGTLAEFNTALQSDSFVSLTGSETLTNKTLTAPTIDDITMTGADPTILAADTDGVLTISANSAVLGAIQKLYGDTHATKAGDIEFLADTTLVGGYDASAQEWAFTVSAASAGKFFTWTNDGASSGAGYKVTAQSGAYVAKLDIATAGALARLGTETNHPFLLLTNDTEAARFDTSRNLLLGGTATPASSVGNLVLFNGTIPSASVTNGVVLYSEDVTASAELKVRDEAGNVTTLSPHNFSLIPDGPSEDMAWGYYSERDGKAINVDLLAVIRAVEGITGETFVYQAEIGV